MSGNSLLGQSLDVVEQNRQRLLALLPEIFTEGSLNIPALKRALGDHSVVEEGERYVLSWAGKADAYKVLQAPTTATVRPQRDLSVNFDQAQHLFIEGEKRHFKEFETVRFRVVKTLKKLTTTN